MDCTRTVKHMIIFIKITLLVGSTKGEHDHIGILSYTNHKTNVTTKLTIKSRETVNRISINVKDFSLNLVSNGYNTTMSLDKDIRHRRSGDRMAKSKDVPKEKKQRKLDLQLNSFNIKFSLKPKSAIHIIVN